MGRIDTADPATGRLFRVGYPGAPTPDDDWGTLFGIWQRQPASPTAPPSSLVVPRLSVVDRDEPFTAKDLDKAKQEAFPKKRYEFQDSDTSDGSSGGGSWKPYQFKGAQSTVDWMDSHPEGLPFRITLDGKSRWVRIAPPRESDFSLDPVSPASPSASPPGMDELTARVRQAILQRQPAPVGARENALAEAMTGIAPRRIPAPRETARTRFAGAETSSEGGIAGIPSGIRAAGPFGLDNGAWIVETNNRRSYYVEPDGTVSFGASTRPPLLDEPPPLPPAWYERVADFLARSAAEAANPGELVRDPRTGQTRRMTYNPVTGQYEQVGLYYPGMDFMNRATAPVQNGPRNFAQGALAPGLQRYDGSATGQLPSASAFRNAWDMVLPIFTDIPGNIAAGARAVRHDNGAQQIGKLVPTLAPGTLAGDVYNASTAAASNPLNFLSAPTGLELPGPGVLARALLRDELSIAALRAIARNAGPSVGTRAEDAVGNALGTAADAAGNAARRGSLAARTRIARAQGKIPILDKDGRVLFVPRFTPTRTGLPPAGKSGALVVRGEAPLFESLTADTVPGLRPTPDFRGKMAASRANAGRTAQRSYSSFMNVWTRTGRHNAGQLNMLVDPSPLFSPSEPTGGGGARRGGNGQTGSTPSPVLATLSDLEVTPEVLRDYEAEVSRQRHEKDADQGKQLIYASTPRLTALAALKKEWAETNNYAPEVGDQIVRAWYIKDAYSKLLANKQNLYIVVPSTSGKNVLPERLAIQLQKDFGGTIWTDAAESHASTAAKELRSLSDKIRKPRSFERGPEFDPAILPHKNVVIVEDIVTTGDTSSALRRSLGLPANTPVVSLGAANLFRPHPRAVRNLGNELYTLANLHRRRATEYWEMQRAAGKPALPPPPALMPQADFLEAAQSYFGNETVHLLRYAKKDLATGAARTNEENAYTIVEDIRKRSTP